VPEDLTHTIKKIAEGPAEAHDEAGGVKQQPLPDVIETDKYLLSKAASKRPSLSLRKVRIIPPGSV
jgi:hypothetical protein